MKKLPAIVCNSSGKVHGEADGQVVGFNVKKKKNKQPTTTTNQLQQHPQMLEYNIVNTFAFTESF